MKWCATLIVISFGVESRRTGKAKKKKKKRLEGWQRFYEYGESQKKIQVLVTSWSRALS